MRIRILSPVILLVLLIIPECKKNSEYGVLGIEVPIGKGKVTSKNPYVVTGVYVDSPAYKQGVRPDDIIIKINDVEIKDGMVYDNIYKKLLLGKPGEKLTLAVKRRKEELTFKIIRSKRE